MLTLTISERQEYFTMKLTVQCYSKSPIAFNSEEATKLNITFCTCVLLISALLLTGNFVGFLQALFYFSYPLQGLVLVAASDELYGFKTWSLTVSLVKGSDQSHSEKRRELCTEYLCEIKNQSFRHSPTWRAAHIARGVWRVWGNLTFSDGSHTSANAVAYKIPIRPGAQRAGWEFFSHLARGRYRAKAPREMEPTLFLPNQWNDNIKIVTMKNWFQAARHRLVYRRDR